MERLDGQELERIDNEGRVAAYLERQHTKDAPDLWLNSSIKSLYGTESLIQGKSVIRCSYKPWRLLVRKAVE